MATMSKGKAVTAAGETSSGKTLGKVPSRPLGRITEQVAMQAMTSKPQHCPLHKQVCCANGRGMGNQGNGWKINGNEAKVSGPPMPTFVKPSNYKDPQRAKRR